MSLKRCIQINDKIIRINFFSLTLTIVFIISVNVKAPNKNDTIPPSAGTLKSDHAFQNYVI